jgi:alpha-D-ribose 1-methylphosphonate 5-triphosphate synthase subunit PhnG
VALEEKDARILPEMGVRVSFLDDRNGSAGASIAQSAVVVPPSAVQTSGNTGVVFVINDTTVERRTVRLGGSSSEGQVVLSGLSSGARLAIADFSQLSDGARVRITHQ